MRYNTGCAFLDYDNDGHADLFVANYLKFDPRPRRSRARIRIASTAALPVGCGPRGLPFDRNILYHNNGDGTFSDVSEQSGIAAPDRNYALGVLTGDFNGDGLVGYLRGVRPDAVAALHQSGQRASSRRRRVLRGVAFDENGKAMSGMGVDGGRLSTAMACPTFSAAISPTSARRSIAIGARRVRRCHDAAGLSRNTRYVGWGCGFFDFDNDGWPDLLLVNGHVFPEVERLGIDIHFKDRAILYRNLGDGKFADVSDERGSGHYGAAIGARGGVRRLRQRRHGRGADQQSERTRRRCSSSRRGRANHWIGLKLDGYTVESQRAGGEGAGLGRRAHANRRSAQRRQLSFAERSAAALRARGGAQRVDRIEIAWPSGSDRRCAMWRPTASWRSKSRAISGRRSACRR